MRADREKDEIQSATYKELLSFLIIKTHLVKSRQRLATFFQIPELENFKPNTLWVGSGIFIFANAFFRSLILAKCENLYDEQYGKLCFRQCKYLCHIFSLIKLHISRIVNRSAVKRHSGMIKFRLYHEERYLNILTAKGMMLIGLKASLGL